MLVHSRPTLGQQEFSVWPTYPSWLGVERLTALVLSELECVMWASRVTCNCMLTRACGGCKRHRGQSHQVLGLDFIALPCASSRVRKRVS